MNNRSIYADDVWSTDGDYLAGLTLLREKFKKSFEEDNYYVCCKTLLSWHSDIIHDTPIDDKTNRMKTMNRVIKIIIFCNNMMAKYGQEGMPPKKRLDFEWKLQVAYKLLMAETALQGKLLKYKPKRLLSQKTL